MPLTATVRQQYSLYCQASGYPHVRCYSCSAGWSPLSSPQEITGYPYIPGTLRLRNRHRKSSYPSHGEVAPLEHLFNISRILLGAEQDIKMQRILAITGGRKGRYNLANR